MNQLIATGHVTRPYLGVSLQPVTPDVATALHLPAGTKGAVVAKVAPNSPAEGAGLVRGDVIVQAGDQRTPDPAALVKFIHQQKVGDKVGLVVLHDGRSKDITVTLAQMPLPQE